MAEVGRYTLDTLQIFFPWDDDLYTYFKKRGLGSSGLGSKKLPLVYTPEALGWKTTQHQTEFVIPAEKPEMGIDSTHFDDTDLLSLSIITRIGRVEQYHLEYSSMSEFGRIYKNWQPSTYRFGKLRTWPIVSLTSPTIVWRLNFLKRVSKLNERNSYFSASESANTTSPTLLSSTRGAFSK